MAVCARKSVHDTCCFQMTESIDQDELNPKRETNASQQFHRACIEEVHCPRHPYS